MVYLSADIEAIINLTGKINVCHIFRTSVKSGRERMLANAINVLYYYRTHVSSTASPSQFVLPEAMKTYPLYLLALLKTPAFMMLSDTKLDLKTYSMYSILNSPLPSFMKSLYPKLYPVTQVNDPESLMGKVTDEGAIVRCQNIPSSQEKIISSGAIPILMFIRSIFN